MYIVIGHVLFFSSLFVHQVECFTFCFVAYKCKQELWVLQHHQLEAKTNDAQNFVLSLVLHVDV